GDAPVAGTPRPARVETNRRARRDLDAGLRSARPEHARDTQPGAAFAEEGAHRMGKVVGARHTLAQRQIARSAVEALEVGDAAEPFGPARPAIGRAARPRARGPDEGRGAGAHAFDGPGAKGQFFDKDTGRTENRHGLLLGGVRPGRRRAWLSWVGSCCAGSLRTWPRCRP